MTGSKLRHFCASVILIDPETKEILLVHHKKFNKWVQPGGHIEGYELPIDTALREVLEETGIKIKIIGHTLDEVNIEPVAVSHYRNKVGDMIDIQYIAIPLTKEINNDEDNDVIWFPIDKLDKSKDIEKEIKVKVKNLVKEFAMR